MSNEEMERMTNKETFDTLVDIKVSLGRLSEKVEQITDMKTTLESTRQTAEEANSRSIDNSNDIKEIKQNDGKKWAAIFTVGATFVLQLIYFLLTTNFK